MNTLQKLFGNQTQIRQQEIELISLLNRWYQVKADLIYAFEKAASSEIKNPMKQYLNEFTTRIKGGIPIEKSLEMFKNSVSDDRFDIFVNHIKFNLKYRGDTGELLENLETQFLKIEQEKEKRKISSFKDRKYIKLLFIVTPVIFLISIIYKESSRNLFLNEIIGQLMLVLGILSYATGIIFYAISSKFKE